MSPVLLRTAAVAGLAAALWLAAGQGRGDVREFNVNGFCLRVDAAPESYNYFPRFAEMKSAPLFYIELGEYSALKAGEPERYGGQKIGERLVVPLNVIKSDPVPKSAAAMVRNIDKNRAACDTKSSPNGLVEILDRDGTGCITRFNSRYYVIENQSLPDRTMSIVCGNDATHCQMIDWAGTGWRLSAPFPEQYIEFWPDIRMRMRTFFEQHLSDC